ERGCRHGVRVLSKDLTARPETPGCRPGKCGSASIAQRGRSEAARHARLARKTLAAAIPEWAGDRKGSLMDHKLAIVIVPKGTRDPVAVSRALLGRFQRPQAGESAVGFEPKFRYKRVGGWFDGLVNGDVGQERWSTVLRMLLDGTNSAELFPGSGTKTLVQMERQ